MNNMTTIVKKDAGERLTKYIEGIENYEAEKQEISESLKEIYDEAKASGFDAKTIRKIVTLRKKDIEEIHEEKYLLESYCEAIQMDLF